MSKVTAETILTLARAEIGVTESPANSNTVKYNTEYYGRAVSGSAYPWCCVFVWWIFNEAGAPELFYGGNKTASCTTLMNYYKKQGQIVSGDYQPGDIVFYQFDTDSAADHVGIIESAGTSTITAIEGNTGTTNDANGGAVMRRSRKRDLIMAVARPEYAEESEEEETLTLDDFKQLMSEYRAELQAQEGSSYSTEAMEWAVNAGLIVGDENGNTMPKDLLTREQLATVLYRYANNG